MCKERRENIWPVSVKLTKRRIKSVKRELTICLRSRDAGVPGGDLKGETGPLAGMCEVGRRATNRALDRANSMHV